MVLLRAVLWLGLVAYLVPYKTIDSADATFTIDNQALLAHFSELPEYCSRHAQTCAQARALAAVINAEGKQALQYVTAKLHLRGEASGLPRAHF